MGERDLKSARFCSVVPLGERREGEEEEGQGYGLLATA